MAVAQFPRMSEPILPPGVGSWLGYVKASADEVHLSLLALQSLVGDFAPWGAVLSRFSSLSIQLAKLHGLVFGPADGTAEDDPATALIRDQCKKLLLKPQLGPQGLLSADLFRSSKDFFEVSEKLRLALAEAIQLFGSFGLDQGEGSSSPSSSSFISASAASPAHSLASPPNGGSFASPSSAAVSEAAQVQEIGALMMEDDPEEQGHDFDDSDVGVFRGHIEEYNREAIAVKQLALMHQQMAAASVSHRADQSASSLGRHRSNQAIHEMLVNQLNSVNFGHRLR